MFPIDPLRNITFLVLDIDRNVGGPHMLFLLLGFSDLVKYFGGFFMVIYILITASLDDNNLKIKVVGSGFPLKHEKHKLP